MPASQSIRTSALLLAVSLAVGSAVATGCVSPTPLADPRPIAAAPTPAQTRIAILRTLAHSNWSLQSETAGQIVVKYGASNWSMVVAIDYGDQVSMHYVSSENLDYDDSKGAPTIHAGYNKRVQQLADQIGKEIAFARVMSDLPPVAAPPAEKTP
jgi:hypothetical protein